ncbi:SCP2 sterol-binding domain-containing protein [Skermanella rosea]|uniref:ubiquinone anaerobic biosynthesis accessory factor UbiT n=1 Tax=Skermanella rosea TaxID=1817965 RepID=UPI0019320987|nr:SCP2 sterol-binding domain-containing protein [Skermanella rosea]UEM06333.1 SCP2 sterol-binding domain-containing protein [Skermanella rosea]
MSIHTSSRSASGSLDPALEPAGTADASAALARAALIASGPLPHWLVQAAFDRLIAVLGRRHPEAFRRLCELTPAELLIDPVDLPQAFLLRVGPRPRLGLTGRGAPAQAVIRGRFQLLLDLLQGHTDGDALFFGRRLAVEGDTALVLAVRNTLDGAEIDLMEDLLALSGHLAPILRPGAMLARRAVPLIEDLLRAGLRVGRG